VKCVVLGLNCSGGQLRDKDGKPFVFKVHDSHDRNQKRYESIGEVCRVWWSVRVLVEFLKILRIFCMRNFTVTELTTYEACSC